MVDYGIQTNDKKGSNTMLVSYLELAKVYLTWQFKKYTKHSEPSSWSELTTGLWQLTSKELEILFYKIQIFAVKQID